VVAAVCGRPVCPPARHHDRNKRVARKRPILLLTLFSPTRMNGWVQVSGTPDTIRNYKRRALTHDLFAYLTRTQSTGSCGRGDLWCGYVPRVVEEWYTNLGALHDALHPCTNRHCRIVVVGSCSVSVLTYVKCV
jgi:hypothetical protein